MKTKTILLSLLIAVTSSFTLVAQGEKTAQVDTGNSKVKWEGKKVTGAHDGTINIAKGSLVMNDGVLTGGEIVIDMSSIVVTDIENPNSNAKLVKHLKSDDFFGVEEHPTATLTIKSAIRSSSQGPVADEKHISKDTYDVTADITIKGTTVELSFPAIVIHYEGGGVRALSQLTIDRTLFDIHYGSDKNLGDKMIYKDFTLSVNLSLN